MPKWVTGIIILMVTSSCFLGNAHAALAANVGYQDFSYGTAVTEPTGDKPQSKLWYNDGLWWGALWNPTARRYEIYQLNQATNTWTTTGVTIDSRGNTHPDMLWDGTRLYSVNAPTDTGSTDQRALLQRYSYDKTTKTYTRDAGYPVQVGNNPMETIVLDKDTTGQLWVTFTQGSQVYVNHSLTSDTSWGTPFVLPVNGTSVSPDDISSVVPFDTKTAAPKMGVMWSNQADNAVYFSTHTDGDADNVWSPSRMALGGPGYADDHINLKSLESDASGRVFAAVKTSRNDGTVLNPDDPLIELLVLGQDGVWKNHVFSQVRENQTKPMVMVDQANRNVYVFATGSGGVIYYKRAPLDNISFSSGHGTPFIKSDTTSINNVTSTKQNISTANGIASAGWVAMANDSNRTYWHNSLILDTTPPETTIDSGPSGTTNSGASATLAFSSTETGSMFECKLDGAAFASCTSPKSYTGLSEGSHTFEVKATDAAGNADATPASRTWIVDTVAPGAPAISSPEDNSSNSDGNVTVSGTAEPGSTVEIFDGATSKDTTQADASGGWSKTLGGVADGSHTYTAKATDAAGNTSAVSNPRTVVVRTADTTAPVTTAPVQGLVANSTVSKQNASAVLVKLTWSGTDNDSIASYELERSTNGGAYVSVFLPSATATSFTDRLEPGNAYQFRVRAKDPSGNWSAWQQGPNFNVSIYQETNSAISYSGTWNTQSFSSAYGGSLKYTSGSGGQQARFTFFGSEVAWVSFKDSDRGIADVYLDGAKASTVDLYSNPGYPRKVAFARKGLDPTVAHTLEVRTTGTKNAASSGKRVDVDAFVVLS